MGFIAILIVVYIIYYLKKKKDERDSVGDFQIQPDYRNVSNELDLSSNNPFVEQSEVQKNINENNNQFNPFIDNDTIDNSTMDVSDEEYSYSNGYIFPPCPVNDKTMSKSGKNTVGKFSYNNDNYIAISYNYLGKKLLLFQKCIEINGSKTTKLVEYSYIWLKLFNIYANQTAPYILQTYSNLQDIPDIPENELNILCKNEESIKLLYGDVEPLALNFGDGVEKVYWKYGDIEFGGNIYNFLTPQINIEDTEIYKVTPMHDGANYNLITDASTIETLWKVFNKKYKQWWGNAKWKDIT